MARPQFIPFNHHPQGNYFHNCPNYLSCDTVTEEQINISIPQVIQFIMMNIQHQSGESKGEFFIEDNGNIRAKITYSKMGNTGIIIDDTEVSEELRGENIGKKLVEHVIEFARSRELEVIPLCPFARMVIEKDKSLQDVVKK